VVADAVADGLIARSGAKTAEGETAGVGAEEPLAEWERELLQGDADAAAVQATGGDAATEGTPAAEATGASSEGAETPAETQPPASDEPAEPGGSQAPTEATPEQPAEDQPAQSDDPA
jgi:small subunit ribosomal protein S2